MVLLGGCGSDDTAERPTSSGGAAVDQGAATSSTSLPDAAVDGESPDVASATPARGEFGQELDLGDDVFVTVGEPTTGGDDRGPWLVVDVEVRNASGKPVAVPVFSIACGVSDPGGIEPGGTFDTGAQVGPGAVVGGTVFLLLPGDRRDGTTPACSSPAFIRSDARNGTSPTDIPLDEELIPKA